MLSQVANDIADEWNKALNWLFSKSRFSGFWDDLREFLDNVFFAILVLLLVVTSPIWVGPVLIIRGRRQRHING